MSVTALIASPSFTFVQLLHELESPSLSYSTDQLSAALRSHRSTLISPLLRFSSSSSPSSSPPPPSSVPSLHEQYEPLLRSFVSLWSISLDQAKRLLQSVALRRVRQRSGGRLSLLELVHELQRERLAAVALLPALLRASSDASHCLHNVAKDEVKEWCEQGGEEKLLATLEAVRRSGFPESLRQPAYSDTSAAASHLNRDDIEQHIALFADESIQQQIIMTEALFLLHYHDDEVSCGKVSTAERIERLWHLMERSDLMRAQPLLPYLSRNGQNDLRWLVTLAVLVVISQMKLSTVLHVLSHPVFQWLEDETQAVYIGMDEKERESCVKEINYMSQELQSQVESIPYFDPVFFESIDKRFFHPSSGCWTSQNFYGPIELAYCSLLSALHEYHTNVAELERFGIDSLQDPALTHNIFNPDLITARLQSVLNRAPFIELHSLIDLIDKHHRPVNSELPDPTQNGYKEILSEMIALLSHSSLYNVFSVIHQRSQLTQVYARTFDKNTGLCTRFWALYAQTEESEILLQDTLKAFPLQLDPLLMLLTALCGSVIHASKVLDPDGLLSSETPEFEEMSIKEAHQCTLNVLAQMSNMKTYATLRPTAVNVDDRHVAALSQVQFLDAHFYQARESIRLDTGVTIPSGSTARLQGDTLIWERSPYSAWPLLADRADRIVSPQTALTLADVRYLSSFFGLLARIVDTDANHFLSVQQDIDNNTTSVENCFSKNFSSDGNHIALVVNESLGSTYTLERIDLCSVALRTLVVLAAHAQVAAAQTREWIEVCSTLCQHISSVLSSAAIIDLQHLTETFVFLFNDARTVALISPQLAWSSTAILSEDNGHCMRTYAHMLLLLHHIIECPSGRYGLTSLSCTLLQMWIPHHSLSLLQLTRKHSQLSAWKKFSTYASNHMLFASLHLAPLFNCILFDIFLHLSKLHFEPPRERWFLQDQVQHVLLLTLGHALSMAQYSLTPTMSMRTVILNRCRTDPSFLHALLQPILCGHLPVEQNPAPTNPILHNLYIIEHLLAIDKAQVEGAHGNGENISMLQSIILSTSHHVERTNTSALLSTFATKLTPSNSVLQALVGYLSRTSSLQLRALQVLTSLVQPPASKLIPASSLFPHFSLVVDDLSLSLAAICGSKSTRQQPNQLISRRSLVWRFLSVMVRYVPAVADLLFSSNPNTTEVRNEKISSSALLSTLVSRVQQLNSEYTIDNELVLEIRSLADLLLSLWSSSLISTQVVTSLHSSESMWTAAAACLGTSGLANITHAYRMHDVAPSQFIHFLTNHMAAQAAYLQLVSLECVSSVERQESHNKLSPHLERCLAEAAAIIEGDLPLLGQLPQDIPDFKSIQRLARVNDIDLALCKNLEYDPDDFYSSRGMYLMEISTRLFHEDLTAALEMSQSQVPLDVEMKEDVSFSCSDSTEIILVHTCEQQRLAQQKFLLQFAYYNDMITIRNARLAVARALRFAVQMVLHKPLLQPSILKIFSYPFCSALLSHLSCQSLYDADTLLYASEPASLSMILFNTFLSSKSSVQLKSYALSIIEHDGAHANDPVETVECIQHHCIIQLQQLFTITLFLTRIATPSAVREFRTLLEVSPGWGTDLSMVIGGNEENVEEADLLPLADAAAPLVSILSSFSLILRYLVYLYDLSSLFNGPINPAAAVQTNAVNAVQRTLPFARGGSSSKRNTLSLSPVAEATAVVKSIRHSKNQQDVKLLSFVLHALLAFQRHLSQQASIAVICLSATTLASQMLVKLQQLRLAANVVSQLAVVNEEDAMTEMDDQSKYAQMMNEQFVASIEQLTLKSTSHSSTAQALAAIRCLSSFSHIPNSLMRIITSSTIFQLSQFSSFGDLSTISGPLGNSTYVQGERNPIHELWCYALTFITGIAQHPCIDIQLITMLANQMIAFHNTFRERFSHVTSQRAMSKLSLADVHEVKCILEFHVALISLYYRLPPSAIKAMRNEWAVVSTDCLDEGLAVSAEIVKLLIDGKLLESRIVAISREEHNMFDSTVILQSLQVTTPDRLNQRTDVKEAESSIKKPKWKPLQAKKNLAVTPVKQPSGPSSALSIGIPSSPSVGSVSFLLRSPALNRDVHAQTLVQTPITTEFILDAARTASEQHVGIASGSSDRAMFIQLIEFGLCTILSHSLALVDKFQSLSGHESPLPLARQKRAAFNYRIRAIHVSNLMGVARSNNITGIDESYAARLQDGDYDELLAENADYDYYSSHMSISQPSFNAVVAVTPVTLSHGSRVPRDALARDMLSDMVSPDMKMQLPSAETVFIIQPPISVVVDLINYCTNVLIRLHAHNPMLRDTSERMLNVTNLFACASAYFSSSVHSFTFLQPTLRDIQAVTLFNLEQALFLLFHQAQLHTTHLINAMHQLSKNATVSGNDHSANANTLQTRDQSEQELMSIRSIALQRISKTLEHYCDGLTILAEEILRLLQPRSAPSGDKERKRRGSIPSSPLSAASPASNMSMPSIPSALVLSNVPPSLMFLVSLRLALLDIVRHITSLTSQ